MINIRFIIEATLSKICGRMNLKKKITVHYYFTNNYLQCASGKLHKSLLNAEQVFTSASDHRDNDINSL